MATTRSEITTLTLPSDREIVITRIFNAPRRLVFDALTKPEHLVHWWGQHGTELSVCEVNLRLGGTWRFVIRMPDGSEYGFSGEYREIVPPERLVQTFAFDGAPHAVAVETLTLIEKDARTHYTARVVHTSAENRDGQINAGMEEGMVETLDRLAEHLKTMVIAES